MESILPWILMHSIQCKQADPKIIVPSYSIITQFSSMGYKNSHSITEFAYPSGPRMHCRPTKQLGQQRAPTPPVTQLTKSPPRAHQPSIHFYKITTVVKVKIYKNPINSGVYKIAFIICYELPCYYNLPGTGRMDATDLTVRKSPALKQRFKSNLIPRP